MGLRGDGVGRVVVPEGFLTGMAATVQASRWDGSWYRRVLRTYRCPRRCRRGSRTWPGVSDGYTPGVTAVVFVWGC